MADNNWVKLSQFGYSGNVTYDHGGGLGDVAARGRSNFGYYGEYDGGGGEGNVERGRSQSLTPDDNSHWEKTRRQSAPVRWHPQYSQPPHPVRASASNWTMMSLDTIPEDEAGNGRNRGIANTSQPQPTHGGYNHNVYANYDTDSNRRFSHAGLTVNSQHDLSGRQRLYQGRSTSEGSLQRIGEDVRRNDGAGQNPNEDKKRRRKSQISFDANSEKDIRNKISDVRSVKSGKSKVSSKYRLSDSVSNSPREARSSSSKGPRSTASRGLHSTSVPGSRRKSNSSRISDASYLSGNKVSDSVSGDSKAEVKVTFAQSPSEIPVELLDLRRVSWKKVLRPLVVTVLVVSLIVSLFVAIYFAAALKESQERQIEFLQATLEFSLTQNQRSRDFNSLTEWETRELKSDYCRQVDAFYRGSSLTDEYRGCQLDVITNDRIEFTLYFLDETGPPKGATEIMSILENRAEQQGLVTISDVTLDLSPSKSSVDLAVTSKPKDFIGVNSRDDQLKGDGSKNDASAKVSVAKTTTTTTTTTTTKPSTPPQMITTIVIVKSRSLDDTLLSKDICKSIKASEVIAHPFSCGHFIQCEFGTPIARPCSGGLVFDPEGSACAKPNANLPCTEVEPCDNVNGGHFAHPTDCRLFEICDQGKSVVLSCPPGLIWDETSQNCVPKKQGTQCQQDFS